MSNFSPEDTAEKEKVFRGAMTLFYKRVNGKLLFLVIKNAQTGNITFVAGAEEDSDTSPELNARREVEEELGLAPEQYELQPTTVKHEFVFGPNKASRAGHKGSYQVFLADVSNVDEIGHTDELKEIHWMTKDEVRSDVSFPDLVEVFEKAAEEIK